MMKKMNIKMNRRKLLTSSKRSSDEQREEEHNNIHRHPYADISTSQSSLLSSISDTTTGNDNLSYKSLSSRNLLPGSTTNGGGKLSTISDLDTEETSEDEDTDERMIEAHTDKPSSAGKTDDRCKISLPLLFNMNMSGSGNGSNGGTDSILHWVIFFSILLVSLLNPHAVKLYLSNISTHPSDIIISSGLGDGKRSPESAKIFFKSVDTNNDGIIKKGELSQYVEKSIGGTAFDTQSEVKSEVFALMKDFHVSSESEGIERSDVYAYWNQNEQLLNNVEEVREWIIFAVQLPEYIGQIFAENGITGYDFAELVENDGLALKEDLGIHKSIYRKKLVRHLRARLMRIGTIPAPIKESQIEYTLEITCSYVFFKWIKPEARGFPVHSHRVQRKDVEMYQHSQHSQSHSQLGLKADSTHSTPIVISSSSSSATTPSDWVNIYTGSESQFHDGSLEKGRHTYIYRIQSWNSVGSSEWTYIDISNELKKKKCTMPPPSKLTRNIDNHDNSHTTRSGIASASARVSSSFWTSILDYLFIFISLIINLVRCIFALIALLASFMRVKRASAPSTIPSSQSPHLQNKVSNFFLKIISYINNLSQKYLHFKIIPQNIFHLFTYSEEERKNNSTEDYDSKVKATGLHGYKNITKRNPDIDFTEGDTPTQRRLKFQRGYSDKSLMKKKNMITKNNNMKNTNSSERSMISGHVVNTSAKRKTFKKSTNGPSSSTRSVQSIQSNTNKTISSISRSFLFKSRKEGNTDNNNNNTVPGSILTKSKHDDNTHDSQTLYTPPPNNNNMMLCQVIPPASSSTLTQQHNIQRIESSNSFHSSYSEIDDYNVCNTCRKKYQFGKRYRHHCSRCLATFCHKHGKTTHPNFLSCKVPGNCLCRMCRILSQNNGGGIEEEQIIVQ